MAIIDMSQSMKKHFTKINIYICLTLIIFSAVILPVKVFAIPDKDFYSGNDILYYDPDDTCDSSSGTTTIGTGFDRSKLARYEAPSNPPEPSDAFVPYAPKSDERLDWQQSYWAESDEARQRAISLGVVESEMINYSRSEVISMIRAEVVIQFNELTDKKGASLAQAQQAILFYQQFEDLSFQLFDESGIPSYTRDDSGSAINILSLTNDKFDGANGKNRRAAASYDIKYAIYRGVQEHMEYFQGSAVSGTGEERWKDTLAHVFYPDDPSKYWTNEKITSPYWEEFANGSTVVTPVTMPYELPATSGRTGYEEAIKPDGTLISGPSVAFQALAVKVDQTYRDYYITMRWNYTSWNWDGSFVGMDTPQNDWFNAEPRIVLVTNERTKKSIYAAALDSGPAPWAGVDNGTNNVPKLEWSNPQKGTPSGYTGRVSGLPPMAYDALGAIQGMYTGEGDILTYQWAPDQTVIPGPAPYNGTVVPTSTDCSSSSTTSPTAGAYGWDLPGEGSHPMVFYDQCADEWNNAAGNQAWHPTNSFCSTACGPTSLAMIVSTLTGDTNVNPHSMATFYKSKDGMQAGGGSEWKWEVIEEKWPELTVTFFDKDLAKAKGVLSRGGLVLFSWRDGPFAAPGGHIVVMRKYSPDGHIYVASSGGLNNDDQSHQAWDESIFTDGYDGQGNSGGDDYDRGAGYLRGLWGIEKK